MNVDGVMTHSTLLRHLSKTKASLPTMRRIIEPINSAKSREDGLKLEKRILASIQNCATEKEILAELEAMGL